jgi:hypothetical protein
LLAILPLAASASRSWKWKWTGTVTPPGEPVTNVTYDVTMKGDTIAITLNAGEHGFHCQT